MLRGSPWILFQPHNPTHLTLIKLPSSFCLDPCFTHHSWTFLPSNTPTPVGGFLCFSPRLQLTDLLVSHSTAAGIWVSQSCPHAFSSTPLHWDLSRVPGPAGITFPKQMPAFNKATAKLQPLLVPCSSVHWSFPLCLCCHRHGVLAGHLTCSNSEQLVFI